MADSDWDSVSEPGNINQNYINVNNNFAFPVALQPQSTEQYNVLSILFPESHPTHKYRSRFEARGVCSVDILRELDHEDLLELGVESRLDRKIILKRIQSAFNDACIPLHHEGNALPEGIQENISSKSDMRNLATFRVVVGEAHNPHRVMINHNILSQSQWNQGESMTRNGWTHKLAFWAFPSKQPGTIRIAVGQAASPHRALINHSRKTQAEWNLGASMTIAGWTQHTEFWAFSKKEPGTIRICAGEAGSPHRLMINHCNLNQDEWNNPNTNMSIAGWGHKMDFWAYPDSML